jgi:hypothetical protein
MDKRKDLQDLEMIGRGGWMAQSMMAENVRTSAFRKSVKILVVTGYGFQTAFSVSYTVSTVRYES